MSEQDSSDSYTDSPERANPSATSPNTSPVQIVVRVLALFLLSTICYATFAFSKLIENSDYLSAFYVAGRAIVSGQPQSLYPLATDRDFHTTAFNLLAHQVLPNLGSNLTAIYMYSPASAVVFAPFSVLPPVASMFVWQISAILALIIASIIVCRLPLSGHSLSRASAQEAESTTDSLPHPGRGLRADDAFFSLCLFLPVIHTILIGQLGILFGILPLIIAVRFLLKRQELAAGFCLSAVLIKPHYLPVVLLIIGALALNKRWRCTVGFLGGSLIVIALSALIAGPSSWLGFFQSLAMTDTFFSNPSYGVPYHLISCFPGVVLQNVPVEHRTLAKLVTYPIAALFGLHALWVCGQLYRKEAPARALLLTLMLGILILPIVIPHLLFYDLCIFGLAGMAVFALPWPKSDKFTLVVWTAISWISLNLYYVLAVSPAKAFADPRVLVVLLTLLYIRMVRFALRS